jgi:maltose-binding protein MalE
MKKIFLFAVCVLLVLCSSCSKKSDVSIDQQSVLSYADPIVDNLLAGFNEENHAKFSRDFDERMRSALPEVVFTQTQQSIVSKIGLYKSRTVSKVQKQGSGTLVIYNAEFEKESGVEVKVVFTKDGEKNLVSGLFFNSPKLRE